MGLNFNNVYQRPYVVKDGRSLVKKKQDEEKSANAQREEQASQNGRSKGLQYIEQRLPSHTPAYQQIQSSYPPNVYSNQPQRSFFTTIPQRTTGNTGAVQTQTTNTAAANEAVPNASLNALNRSSNINIAQIIKDFNNTAIAIGTPEELKSKVDKYISLVQDEVTSAHPDTKLVKSNLKNASTILDNYISETLNKKSKVVENWVDALFLQQIDFKYNEEDVNPQFLVKFPEGSLEQDNKVKSESTATKVATEENTAAQPQKTEEQTSSLIPQDKELKSLFLKSKKLAYANEPKKAIEAFQQALVRANEIGDTETQSKIFFEIGKIYQEHQYYSQALKSFNMSSKSTEDNNIKTKSHYSMAQIYDDVNQITPALDHYFATVSFAGEAENLVAQSTSMTKIGNIYTDMYEREAFDYYEIADGLAEQTDNSRVKGYIASSTGKAYDRFGEPQEALKLYSRAVQNYTDADAPSKVAQNYMSAGEIMLEYSSPNKARGLFEKAQAFAKKTNDEELLNRITEKLSQLG